ncbi:MAG: prepilin-type N-terminal cleavage/methylation domain-containing protein [Desulfobacterales bacterium]|jgi:general secretion pathway protein G
MSLFKKLKNNSNGLTLIEILIAVAVIGLLAGVAVPGYISYRNKANISTAIDEMKLIEFDITNYLYENNEYPDSLSDIGKDNLLDPWGNPYRYLRIDGGKTKGLNGERRRDKNANPVNSDYDLYSMGKDGKTSAQFMAKKARDDVVRANDGDYYGLAEEH